MPGGRTCRPTRLPTLPRSHRDNPKDGTHAEQPAPSPRPVDVGPAKPAPHLTLIAEQPGRPRNQQRWRRQLGGKRRLPGLSPFSSNIGHHVLCERVPPNVTLGHPPRPLAGGRAPRDTSHDLGVKSCTQCPPPRSPAREVVHAVQHGPKRRRCVMWVQNCLS